MFVAPYLIIKPNSSENNKGYLKWVENPLIEQYFNNIDKLYTNDTIFVIL